MGQRNQESRVPTPSWSVSSLRGGYSLYQQLGDIGNLANIRKPGRDDIQDWPWCKKCPNEWVKTLYKSLLDTVVFSFFQFTRDFYFTYASVVFTAFSYKLTEFSYKMKSILAINQVLSLLGTLLSQGQQVRADNPIIQTIYTADPAPFVYNGRVYLFADHDEDGSTTYNMKDWRLFSSSDIVNWQDHGIVMSLQTFKWSNANAWAGQVWPRNGKFYYYAPMRHTSGSMAVGVGVSDNITGPYVDALGKPLVQNNEFDPTIWIDDDNQAYMFWGNPNLWYVKLNQDMISYSGSPTKIQLTTAGFGSTSRGTTFTEGPWIYKRGSLYYLLYAANGIPEDIRYSTAPRITGPWTYRGIIMPNQGKSFTNHPAVIDFNGTSYFFYHNGALPGGSGYTRSIAVESFVYKADGMFPTIQMTTNGPPQIGTLNPYVRQEAETIAFSSGLKTEVCSEGGMDVTNINNGDYIKVKGVAFGAGVGAKSFSARVASSTSGGSIQLRQDSTSGSVIGTCNVAGTGGAQKWTTVTCPVSGATGTKDLFFRFTGNGSGQLFNFNWWQFEASNSSRIVV